ncbi:hypothetical protein JMJ94_05315 [Rhodovulum visakhapatnamense]|uniref:hypothetical protein n=1 Tax=Rhodovulum visakhapatnamense TaxID=364297 RepID=UPI001179BDBB|nr:hypothetical protein [Rhodovulum visakhapatnamense]MBL3568925.1 hypothetical protein [Rhodovulum visakhapatnamense]
MSDSRLRRHADCLDGTAERARWDAVNHAVIHIDGHSLTDLARRGRVSPSGAFDLEQHLTACALSNRSGYGIPGRRSLDVELGHQEIPHFDETWS